MGSEVGVGALDAAALLSSAFRLKSLKLSLELVLSLKSQALFIRRWILSLRLIFGETLGRHGPEREGEGECRAVASAPPEPPSEWKAPGLALAASA